MFFFGFSTQNHAESFGNYVKHSVLDPKRGDFIKNRDLDMSGPAKASPRGPGGDKSLSAGQAFTFSFQKLHLSVFHPREHMETIQEI